MDLQFDASMLRASGNTRPDVSQFGKKNVVLPGTYRVDVYINNAWYGRKDINMRDQDGETRPCISRDLLEKAGMNFGVLPPETAQKLAEMDASCIRLDQLVDKAGSSFDAGKQRLDISIPQAALKQAARGEVDPESWDDGVPAAILQYNANVYHTESNGYRDTQSYLGLDAGFNLGPWRFRHSGSYSYSDSSGSDYQASRTYLQRAIAPLKSQLTLGDAYSDGTVLDSFGFRGVQLGSDDRMLPQSQRGYAPVVRGTANTNAKVQVKQGGNILYETTVAPGAFEITDLYPTGYGGDLEVIVTEADGSEHVSRVPYAAAVAALRPGITRYNALVGEYRDSRMEGDAPLVGQLTLQHGFTNLLTGYGGLTVAEGYTAAALGVALNTDYGAFGFDVTAARTQLDNEADRSGQSYRLSYSRLLPTDTNISVAAYRYSTEGYLNLSDAMYLRDLDARGISHGMTGISRGRLQLTLNQALPEGWGSFYLSGSSQTYWNRADRDTQFQFGYNNRFGNINYNLSLSRDFDATRDEWDNRAMLNVSIPLGGGYGSGYANSNTSVQYDSASGDYSARESLSGSLGRNRDFSYGLSAGYASRGDDGGQTDINGNIGYTTPIARLSASAGKSGDSSQASVSASGSMVLYGGGVAFSPDSSDTFVVVEADGAAGARVLNGSGLRVDPWGHALIAGAQAYSQNDIALDPKGIPLNIELQSTLEHAVPTAGAVVPVKFKTTDKGRTVSFKLRRADGQAIPFGASVVDADGNERGVMAQGGRVLVKGLNLGLSYLTVKMDGKEASRCGFTYELPAQVESEPVKLIHQPMVCQ
ncbi:fimbria/pilus outer membrane usher protein [Jeongeupia sp. USM3]|uniref:fimbria/pilus outer membrane usher protein n=1 Tax=Jeongeupia sp. USM3 TaxID=1906741 RepID=UPI00143A331A|nr:fimbria/pilus outer membrane usher protein [Jeongeupia sp. USM3]